MPSHFRKVVAALAQDKNEGEIKSGRFLQVGTLRRTMSRNYYQIHIWKEKFYVSALDLENARKGATVPVIQAEKEDLM